MQEGGEVKVDGDWKDRKDNDYIFAEVEDA